MPNGRTVLQGHGAAWPFGVYCSHLLGEQRGELLRGKRAPALDIQQMRRDATLLIKHRDAIRRLAGRLCRLCSTAQRFTADDTKTELMAVSQETCLWWYPTLNVAGRGLTAIGDHGLSRGKSRCFQGHVPALPPTYGQAGTNFWADVPEGAREQRRKEGLF